MSSVALPSESGEQSALGKSSSAERSSLVLTPELREELAAVPDIRQLVRNMVDGAVNRAIAPLLEKQQELEAALKELRTLQSRSEQLPGPSPERAVGVDVSAPPRVAQVEPRRAAPCPPVTQANAVTVPTRSRDAAAVVPVPAHDRSTVVEIPAELDGSRRKRTIALSIGVVMLLAVLCMAGLSVLSNMGIRI